MTLMNCGKKWSVNAMAATLMNCVKRWSVNAILLRTLTFAGPAGSGNRRLAIVRPVCDVVHLFLWLALCYSCFLCFSSLTLEFCFVMAIPNLRIPIRV